MRKALLYHDTACWTSVVRDCSSAMAQTYTHQLRAEFATAAALYERAVELASADTRKGGEYTLWLAQAMHAAGEEAPAISMLKALEKSHRDRAVCVVAAEILFILTAPKLELGRDSFIGCAMHAL